MRFILPLFGISFEDDRGALDSLFWGAFDLKVPCTNLDAGGETTPRLARPRRVLVPRWMPVFVSILVDIDQVQGDVSEGRPGKIYALISNHAAAWDRTSNKI